MTGRSDMLGSILAATGTTLDVQGYGTLFRLSGHTNDESP